MYHVRKKVCLNDILYLEKEVSMDGIKLMHQEFRKIAAMALYNNLLWWANGTHDVDDESLRKAFELLDNIMLRDFKNEFVITANKNTVFYRARNIEPTDYTKTEKGISYSDKRLYGFNWIESKEPPEENTKEGRNSKKGEAALYLAYDEATACMEARPKIKQLVSVAQFELQENIEIIDFSKLQYNQPLNKYDERYDVDVRYFLGRVFALFTYPVYDENYIVTQKIVDHFRKYGFQGIAYRSLYTGKANYTFYGDSRKLFVWKDSRVLVNYAAANLFVSLDNIEEHNDVSNRLEIEKEVSSAVRQDMLKSTKQLFTNGAEVS